MIYFVDETMVLMDQYIYQSASYQRVHQYLSNQNFATFQEGTVEKNVSEVLSLLLRLVF